MNRATVLLLSIALLASCGLWEEDKPSVFTDSCAHLPAGEWVSLGLETEVVTALASDPRDPGILYAGTGFHPEIGTAGRLYKSTDCGASWTLLLTMGGTFRHIIFDPINPEILYAVNGGIHKSVNGGRKWTPMSTGIDINMFTQVTSLAIDPDQPRRMFAGTAGFGQGTLYHSGDGGRNWRVVTEPESGLLYVGGGVSSIVFHPRITGTLFIGLVTYSSVVLSTDTGQSWQLTSLNSTVTGGFVRKVLVTDSDPSLVVAAVRSDGAWISNDVGTTWGRWSPNSSVEKCALYDMNYDPSISRLVFAYGARNHTVVVTCNIQDLTCSAEEFDDPIDDIIQPRIALNHSTYRHYLLRYAKGVHINIAESQ